MLRYTVCVCVCLCFERVRTCWWSWRTTRWTWSTHWARICFTLSPSAAFVFGAWAETMAGQCLSLNADEWDDLMYYCFGEVVHVKTWHFWASPEELTTNTVASSIKLKCSHFLFVFHTITYDSNVWHSVKAVLTSVICLRTRVCSLSAHCCHLLRM